MMEVQRVVQIRHNCPCVCTGFHLQQQGDAKPLFPKLSTKFIFWSMCFVHQFSKTFLKGAESGMMQELRAATALSYA